MLRRILFPALAGAAIVLGSTSLSGAETLRGQPKAVVELFTSQGCSSCPPADAMLTSLAERDDVVALAYHVDYWDYIGWEDTFANPGYSDRQRAYAKSWGSSSVFTPQMVINGEEGVIGSRRDEVQDAVASAQLPLSLLVERHGDMLKIGIPPDHGLGDATIWLVRYTKRANVDVGSGENAGKAMVYTQVVTGRQMLGMWEAQTGAQVKLPLGELRGDTNGGFALLVQQERNGLPGPILGAAVYEF